ncbi:MAG: hypothetical protein ACRD3W_07900, partial [Terriglobales bacterium]
MPPQVFERGPYSFSNGNAERKPNQPPDVIQQRGPAVHQDVPPPDPRQRLSLDAWRQPPKEKIVPTDRQLFGVSDFRKPGFQDPYRDLSEAGHVCFKYGFDAAKPIYEQAVKHADSIDQTVVQQERQKVAGQMAQLQKLSMQPIRSAQDAEKLDAARYVLNAKEARYKEFYLSPATTRVNDGLAAIHTQRPELVAAGEKLIGDALRMRPEIRQDQNFLNALRKTGETLLQSRDPKMRAEGLRLATESLHLNDPRWRTTLDQPAVPINPRTGQPDQRIVPNNPVRPDQRVVPARPDQRVVPNNPNVRPDQRVTPNRPSPMLRLPQHPETSPNSNPGDKTKPGTPANPGDQKTATPTDESMRNLLIYGTLGTTLFGAWLHRRYLQKQKQNAEQKPTTEVKPPTAVKPTAEEKPATEVKPAAEEKPATEVKPTAEEKPATEVKPAPVPIVSPLESAQTRFVDQPAPMLPANSPELAALKEMRRAIVGGDIQAIDRVLSSFNDPTKAMTVLEQLKA